MVIANGVSMGLIPGVCHALQGTIFKGMSVCLNARVGYTKFLISTNAQQFVQLTTTLSSMEMVRKYVRDVKLDA